MTYLVVKFGGTSVGSIEHIKAAALRIADLKSQGNKIVVVVSAMAGETNRLAELTKSFKEKNQQVYDTVVSTGEQVTTGLMALALQEQDIASQPLQGWQVPLITSSDFSKARFESIPTHNLKALLDQDIIPVIPGFQGVTKEGNITTLGRGGSDVTAVVLAAALEAKACHLYKDVPGILTSDPDLVEAPQVLDHLGIEEMFELSSQGAKVIHPRAIEAALVHQVCLKVLPTFGEGQGTTMASPTESLCTTPLESETITGIVCNTGEVRICLQNIPVSPGATTNLFHAFAKANISLDMILQGGGVTADSSTQNLTFTISESDQKEAVSLTKSLQKTIGFTHMDVHPRIAKVSLVGAGLRGHANVAYVLHKTLADLGISLYGMTTTELKMSVLVSNEYATQLVRALHDNFNLTNPQQKRKEGKDATGSTLSA